MMVLELLRELTFWVAITQLVWVTWWIYKLWRGHKTREAVEDKKPPLSDEVVVMRPGDTALVVLKTDGMTLGQQRRMLDDFAEMRNAAKERGIDMIALPVRGGDRAVVIARS